jgi:hypothetical protein
MTRRELLALSSLLLPLGSMSLAAEASRKPRKKGLCLTTKKRPAEKVLRFLESVGAGWVYNWNIDPLPGLPASVEFVPMVYQGGAETDQTVSRIKAEARTRRYHTLLGFNEPDAKTQGDTTVEQALDLWPKLESTGLRLGSPATVHPDNEWMMAFMEGVEKRRLRVDFICMHSYGGPGVENLVKRIEKIHALFKRPIWITEFAVADWNAKTAARNRFPAERIAAFVRELLPQLEAMDIVERYAWFHGGVSGGPLATSKLFNPDGSLTVVGKAYRSVG